MKKGVNSPKIVKTVENAFPARLSICTNLVRLTFSARWYFTMKLSPNQSLAGILEPVFAIRAEADLGIGDTEGVRQMIDWCHRRGLAIFQTLPINETSDDNSPYNAISSLAIEPATIAVSPRHIPELSTDDFVNIASADAVASLRRGPVDYPKVKALKR